MSYAKLYTLYVREPHQRKFYEISPHYRTTNLADINELLRVVTGLAPKCKFRIEEILP